jgi:hypothetical protein
VVFVDFSFSRARFHSITPFEREQGVGGAALSVYHGSSVVK